MTIALATFRTQTQTLIPQYTDTLSDEDCNRAVRAAVEQYSADFPDEETDDVTGDAGKFYVLSTSLDSFSEQFSRVLTIEYPAATVASDEAPQYMDPGDWRDDYWAGDVRYLWLPNHAPAATESMRITYTKPYAWVAGGSETSVNQNTHGFSVDDLIYDNDGTWTSVGADAYKATHVVSTVTDGDNFKHKALYVDVPPAHFFAVCYLAACLACRQIATSYASIGDSTIAADATAHQTKSDTYAARATDYCAKYREIVGLDAGGAEGGAGMEPPAGEFVDWDTSPGWPSGRDYLFHGRHHR